MERKTFQWSSIKIRRYLNDYWIDYDCCCSLDVLDYSLQIYTKSQRRWFFVQYFNEKSENCWLILSAEACVGLWLIVVVGRKLFTFLASVKKWNEAWKWQKLVVVLRVVIVVTIGSWRKMPENSEKVISLIREGRKCKKGRQKD